MSCALILALDYPTLSAARPLLKRLNGSLRWVKIGLQMFTAEGPDCVRAVADQGFDIFLDLKLHDIPNTVARAVDSLATLPIGMLTIHTAGGREMLAGARAAQSRGRPELLLLGVTVLTSMDAAGLAEIGVAASPEAQVDRMAALAVKAGLRGLVCSPLEVTALRTRIPADVKLVVPGIRLAGETGGDDQKRVITPGAAARAGADYIVVGRPILPATDPAATAQAILADLA